MANILSILTSFPPQPSPEPLSDSMYEHRINQLLTQLHQIPASQFIESATPGGTIFDILDPSLHTLSYLYALLAHIQHSVLKGAKSEATYGPGINSKPGDKLWNLMTQFLKKYDPRQVRYAGADWRRLVEHLAGSARAASNPAAAIEPIKTAMIRLDPTLQTVTSTHVLYLELCLESREYAAALPLFVSSSFGVWFCPGEELPSNTSLCNSNLHSSQYIVDSDVNGLSAQLHYEDFHYFLLFGATALIGLELWDEAFFLLKELITWPIPDGIISKMMVEGYKKWVLLAFIREGSQSNALPIPKEIGNQQASKTLRNLSSAYGAVTQAFISGNRDLIEKEIDAGREVWEDDCNTGLINQLLLAFRRYSIINLSRTYATLTLPEVCRRTSPYPENVDESRSYIESLIEHRHLDAELSSPDCNGTMWLKFIERPLDHQAEEKLQSKLEQQIAEGLVTSQIIQTLDHKMALSNEYLDWSKKMRKAELESKDVPQIGDITMGDVEEDVMADI